jgi:hypothetical protein
VIGAVLALVLAAPPCSDAICRDLFWTMDRAALELRRLRCYDDAIDELENARRAADRADRPTARRAADARAGAAFRRLSRCRGR